MRTALITGAAGGIGQALCRAFAGANYRVILHVNRNEAGGKALLSELEGQGASARLIRFDLLDRAGVSAALLGLGEKVDVLVNNAGLAHFGLFQEADEEALRRVFGSTCSGPWPAPRPCCPAMISRRWGRIINVASMWGEVGASCESLYSAAKAGLIGWTKALAKEEGPSLVTVNCISPGFIDTPMNEGISPADREAFAESTPIPRVGPPRGSGCGRPFLASEEAGFVTGQVLGVNGGFVTGG